jgi:hypothetical protein
MAGFSPPIYTREDDELIIIASSSTDDWQQDAIKKTT